MKIPSEKEIIEEVEKLKAYVKGSKYLQSFQVLNNKLNKILRMLKQPGRRVEFNSWAGKSAKRWKSK